MAVEIRSQAFDPWHELSLFHRGVGQGGQCGATASFVGTMRDTNEGRSVQAMSLEYYSGMTQRYLEKICDHARARWPLLDALIIHRVGDVVPGEPIVLVAVWSAHRAPAFEACRYLIEELKSCAPLWKKESSPDGTRWVSCNTPGSM